MWRTCLWNGKVIVEEDGDEKEEKIKTPSVIFDEKVYKPDRNEEVIVTMQLDKDQLLFWVGAYSYGVVCKDKDMNTNDVRPFVRLYDEGDSV